MKSRISRLLVAAGVAALLTTACNVDPQQAGQAAERVMTVAAQITPEAVETAMASAAQNTPAPAVSANAAEAPVIYARCITRGAAALTQLPEDGAAEVASLDSRSIITAFGRTEDATWVLGWNADKTRGWLPAAIVGCTAPVEELRVTDVSVLLTPVAVAEVTTEPTTVVTTEATAELTVTTTTNAVTATAEATLESTMTEVPAATPTTAPNPTATALPTDVPIPTAAPARTTLPTATPLAATATPASPMRVITVVVVVTATPQPGAAQVRDLRCTVTPGTPVNLRNAPARTASLLITLQPGTRFLAQGRNADATWVYGFTERQTPGWLIASSVDCDGDPAQLVEVDR